MNCLNILPTVESLILLALVPFCKCKVRFRAVTATHLLNVHRQPNQHWRCWTHFLSVRRY